ncbi:MAG: ATP-dependent endonuclease [Pseudorhodoplanes sp.]
MKLVSVTVQNFRSISTARRIPIAQLTTLVGPNNEGKSNILRALVIATNTLIDKRPGAMTRARRISMPSRRRRGRQDRYVWVTDCPLRLQSKASNGSTITLEFDLSETEIEEFRVSIGSKLNGTLPISFSFTKDREAVTIPKQGRGQKVLNSKANQIAAFIAGKIEIQYIPAVRTAESSLTIVDDLVSRELEKIEANPKYQQALAEIAALQEPILDDLSQKITATMKEFLPNIAQAKILILDDDRNVALRGISEMNVDDGAETPLDYKGDGVQSLAAIALMRHVSQMQHQGKDVLIALEEPESHLHPLAIRQLRKVLMELSTRHQVVITTHNPIFTNRSDIHQNIIVSQNRAYSAASVKDVRQVLGVRLDDNLSSAEVVLIVEGEEDRIALKSILSSMDSELNKEIKSGRIAIDVLGGASNLSHRIRLHTEAMCKVHVFLDDDGAGKQAYKLAQQDGIIEASGVNFSTVSGKTEAELEDLYDGSVYESIIHAEAGLPWVEQGPDSSKKWADRLRNILRRAGKPHDDPAVMAIKIKVATSAASQGVGAMHVSKKGPVESLVSALKSKLDN